MRSSRLPLAVTGKRSSEENKTLLISMIVPLKTSCLSLARGGCFREQRETRATKMSRTSTYDDRFERKRCKRRKLRATWHLQR